jgi:hypothetical protein
LNLACASVPEHTPSGPTRYEDSVVIFRAQDWDAAFRRALEIGRGMEVAYRNGDGVSVEKRLVEIRTLDELGDELSDGREVWCAPAEVATAVRCCKARV